MTEKSFQIQPDTTLKSRIKNFYYKNKIKFYSTLVTLIILLSALSIYLENKDKKKFELSESYIKAKIFLEAGNNQTATIMLKKIILADDSTYSPLSLFLIIEQDLITDEVELIALFDHLIKRNKFPIEIENLLILKKSFLLSNSANEAKLLETINPLINSDSTWRSHALLLLGDYFVYKNENLKAIDFYQKILTIKNLHPDLYNHARNQLETISNE